MSISNETLTRNGPKKGLNDLSKSGSSFLELGNSSHSKGDECRGREKIKKRLSSVFSESQLLTRFKIVGTKRVHN